ncbi:SAUR-like auxin-responsive protein family [Abeliophyllum distichum]|uniref:SAUR-like auxin-responsive protein family n=1 Tax=Abeliophyllum distichum TaxID=126358 RepID=A0ABD1Q8R4_9LAMI
MGKTRVFKLGHKLVKVFKWWRSTRRRDTYQRLEPPRSTTGTISKLCKWVYSLKHGAKALCYAKKDSGHYIRVGQEQVKPNHAMYVPKGDLAVYVGDKDDDTCRILVPVAYINHPLFGELLREAEKVYGFNHRGGIQIPCRKSEFENVQSKIAAACDGGSRHGRRSWRLK